MSLLPQLPHKQCEPVQEIGSEEPKNDPCDLEEPDRGGGDVCLWCGPPEMETISQTISRIRDEERWALRAQAEQQGVGAHAPIRIQRSMCGSQGEDRRATQCPEEYWQVEERESPVNLIGVQVSQGVRWCEHPTHVIPLQPAGAIGHVPPSEQHYQETIERPYSESGRDERKPSQKEHLGTVFSMTIHRYPLRTPPRVCQNPAAARSRACPSSSPHRRGCCRAYRDSACP